MAKQIFANNASSLLAASIDDNDLAIQVGVGEGALFPNPGAGEFFLIALVNADGDFEICKVTSRSTDILTVATGGRAQEGTTAQSWTNGQTRVELRNTKGTLDRFLQREGDVMSGDLDMDGNDVIDPSLTGDWKGTNGQLVGTVLRGTEDDASNEVAVPGSGGRATAGGVEIVVKTDTQPVRELAWVVGMIIDWYGAAVDCPDGFAICDGTNGTPDMRDRVSVGASGTKSLGSDGGSETATGNTGSSGSHNHGGATGSTTLTTNQIPSHTHPLPSGARFVDTAGTNDSISGGPQAGHRNDSDLATAAAGGGQGHDHSISSDGSHTHSLSGVSVVQPYVALHKIMFIGF